ncbi:YggT family protein [Maridesulfovibrio ferrireducens]|uniref:YggT family protein n=1 Tax=Maridesulfovibrio ferrireducens TaxID=246191 RepID=A0A1G9HJM5_9BACT|nr:YggT family protein [Maridesulfovibrio ferrireducens]MBI9110475.1 YggT family protein [Maridesulfovibrio ferrireducens]SDL13085.1 YggT family protein [Maridesulfovibrio ferrireducens]
MDYVILAVAKVLQIVLNLYMWVVIISALITWVNPDPYNPVVRFLRKATEPVFAKVRQYIPFVNIGGFDLSPIVVILIIQMLDIALVGNLTRLAYGM